MPVFAKEFLGLQCLVSAPLDGPEPHPVLVFLHGRDEAAPLPGQAPNLQVKLTLHGPLAPSAAAIAGSFLIVAPQLPHPGGNVWPTRASTVEQLARIAAAEQRGDPARTYLTGFSYGGNGVLELGARPSGVWAALWAVDPPAAPARLLASPLWVSGGRYASPHAGQYGTLGFTPPQSAGVGDSIYEFVGPGHGEVARAAYGNPKPYQWLLMHRA